MLLAGSALIAGALAGCEKAQVAAAGVAVAAAPPAAPTPPQVPTPADPVAIEMPGILKQVAALDFPAAYVALRELDAKHPGHPDVQRLLGEITPVLAQITPGAKPPAAAVPASARRPKRLAELPAFEQTQFRLFVKQAQAKRELPALLKDVKAFCVQHPDFAGGWLLQAQLALALQRPLEGSYAAQNLMALGAPASTDRGVIATMAALEEAGWVESRK